MERRWHARSEIDVFATLYVKNDPRPMPCRITNFGASGFFAEIPRILKPNQFVEVWVHPENMPERIIEGMVVHRRDVGVGIETASRSWALALGWG